MNSNNFSNFNNDKSQKTTDQLLKVLKNSNEIVVFKVMDKHGLDVYDRLKDLDNSNIVDVMDCFLHEDKCVAVEEFVNGKRLCDVLQKNIPACRTHPNRVCPLP